MTTFKHCIAISLLTLAIFVASVMTLLKAAELPASSRPYRQMLRALGERLDCYFTIERRANSAVLTSPLSSSVDLAPLKVADVAALVVALRKELKGVTVVRSDADPQVIHLIETALLNGGGYPIDQKLNFDGGGGPDDLVNDLIQCKGSQGLDKWTGEDFPANPALMEVGVVAENRPVRYILTKAVTLKDASRIIWEAKTFPPDSVRRHTQIRLLGLKTAEYSDDYLYAIAEHLNCYFTCEEADRSDADGHYHQPALTLSRVSWEEVDSVDDLVIKLRDELPGVTVVRSTVAPRVIHLIETAALKTDGYPLDRKISLSFHGKLFGLLDALESRLKVVRPFSANQFPMLISQDYETTTDLSVKDCTVRDVLTQAVPLKGYSRIIWSSSVSGRDKKCFADVNYPGPSR